MTNKYDSYESELFTYEYPYTWERRNRNYLRKVYDRRKEKQYILPIVFRLRFYSSSGVLISDDTYSPNTHNRIKFPDPELIPGITFVGWKFSFKGKEFCITPENFVELKEAIMFGADDIKLTAYYEEASQLVSIYAQFNQTQPIYSTNTLDDLRPMLVVTAEYIDGTTEIVEDYTLQGVLINSAIVDSAIVDSSVVGGSIITVLYRDKITTFAVFVSPQIVIPTAIVGYARVGAAIAG